MSLPDLQAQLKTSTPESLRDLKKNSRQTEGSPLDFEDFFSREINFAPGTREMASISQNNLRDLLRNRVDRDATFPVVLQNVDNDFLGGSYSRHTKIWPLDDIEVYVPLDGKNLQYVENGQIQPYTVASDNVIEFNPLLQDPARWMEGGYISSRKLIEGFTGVLNGSYPSQTKVKPAGEAVRVQMKQGETESADGLGFDVVPCFLLSPLNGNPSFYFIPDGHNGWIRTNPRCDQDLSERLQRESNGLLRKVVKLVKYWNVNCFGKKLGSYFIELAIMQDFASRGSLEIKSFSLPEAIHAGFAAVLSAASNGNQQPLITGAPLVARGIMIDQDLNVLSNTLQHIQNALAYTLISQHTLAQTEWVEVFGEKILSSN